MPTFKTVLLQCLRIQEDNVGNPKVVVAIQT